MTRHHLAAALLIAAPFAASAAPAPSALQPVQLEAVIVTPKATYSASQWQARHQLAAAQAAPVVLEPVIVTPARRYTVAEWRAERSERHYVAGQMRKARHWLRAVWHTLGFKSHPQEA